MQNVAQHRRRATQLRRDIQARSMAALINKGTEGLDGFVDAGHQFAVLRFTVDAYVPQLFQRLTHARIIFHCGNSVNLIILLHANPAAA